MNGSQGLRTDVSIKCQCSMFSNIYYYPIFFPGIVFVIGEMHCLLSNSIVFVKNHHVSVMDNRVKRQTRISHVTSKYIYRQITLRVEISNQILTRCLYFWTPERQPPVPLLLKFKKSTNTTSAA